jgi:hypothetical protein
MLHVREIQNATYRKGVDEQRLKDFSEDPDTYKPGLCCTRLDTRGQTIEELMESKWNQSVIHRLAMECKAIASISQDRSRFSNNCDWVALAWERVYRLLLAISHAVPEEDENDHEAAVRVLKEYYQRNDRAKNTQSQHVV